MSKPSHLDDEADLDAFVADHDVALVEFYTKGCSMCQAMEPVLGNVARELRARREARNERAARGRPPEGHGSASGERTDPRADDARERAAEVAVGLVNPGDDVGLVGRFDVRSVPLLVLFVDGDPVARKAEGFQGVDDVIAFLEANAPERVPVEA